MPSTASVQASVLLSSYILLAENPVLTKSGFPTEATPFVVPATDFQLMPGEEYWVKFRMQDTVSAIRKWISFEHHHQIDLFHKKEWIGKAGNGVNQTEAMHPAHRYWIRLPEKGDSTVEYLFHLQTDQLDDPALLMPRLATISQLDKQRYQTVHDQQKKYGFYWSMMVIIGFLAVISFAQYCFNKDKTYLYYGFYLAFNFFYLLFTFERNSVYCIFLKKYFAGYQNALIIPTLMLSYYCYTQFSRYVLNTKVVNSAFDRLLRYFGNTTLVFLVVDILFGVVIQPDFYAMLRNGMLIGTFLLAVGCLFSLFGIKNKIATLVFAGTLIFSLGSFLGFLVSTLITLPPHWGIWSDGYAFMQIGIVAEVLCFSVALAYRSRQIEKDKNLANAQLIKENYEKEKFRYENKKRQEFERVRSRFFADTNHELRTPLTVIQGTAEMMEVDDDKRDTILRNTHSMISLINNMLQLSKLEMGKTEVEKVRDNIIPFLAEQVLVWSHYAAQQDIELKFQQEQDSLVMDFDDKKMVQILNNLLSNAIKFTQGGGTITITAEENQGHFLLRVEDTGVGIPAEDLPHIFDRYYQSTYQQPTHVEGTGIGLALVHQLVLLLNGTVAVASQPRKGTCFELSFPITCTATATKATFTNTVLNPTPLEKTETTPASTDSKELILLVEDQPELLQHLKTALQNNYSIITAVNGADGIEQAMQHAPDLIISDVVMPLKSGFELCEILKNNFDTSHIPIILLTARVGEANKIKGLQQGADAYLTKPFSQSELLLRIENLIHVRKMLHLRFSQNVDEATIQQSSISSHDQAFLDTLTQYIITNFNTGKLEGTYLEQATNTSRSTLFRKLKVLTGKSTSQFKKQVRMLEAKRLLATEEYTISELAYHIGYTQPSNFSKDFKDYFGMAPTEYKG